MKWPGSYFSGQRCLKFSNVHPQICMFLQAEFAIPTDSGQLSVEVMADILAAIPSIDVAKARATSTSHAAFVNKEVGHGGPGSSQLNK